jgi:hypothetical protein
VKDKFFGRHKKRGTAGMKTIRWLNLLLILAFAIGPTPGPGLTAKTDNSGSFSQVDDQTRLDAPQTVGLYSAYLTGIRPGGVFPLSYIQIPYSYYLNSFPNGITLEAWVRRDDASRYESVICNGWMLSYCLSFAGSKIRLQTSGGASYVDSAGDVPAGVWTHIAATYDGLYQKLYINGRLDTSRYYPGSVAGGSGTPLGIGADLVNDFDQNYFKGFIDEVRIWENARSAASIQSTMFTPIRFQYPGLLANWHLDGDALDSSGGNNGITQDVRWQQDSALPHDLHIPLVQVTPTLDANCDLNNEYANAAQVVVSWNAATTIAYLQHNGTDLWVCFTPLTPAGHGGMNWTALYLDRGWNRDQFAQPDDLTLEVYNNNTTAARQGDGQGNYVTSSTANGLWAGKFKSVTTIGTVNTAEFRVSLSLIGPPGTTFGLKLAQNWVLYPGDNRDWPALSVWNSPATWSAATLGQQGSLYSYSGKVLYQPHNPASPLEGVAGVRVNMVAGDGLGTWVVADSAISSVDGSFSLSANHDYPLHWLEIDALNLPRGYTLASSYAPNVSAGNDPRVINYGGLPSGSYTGAEFHLTDSLPPALNRGMGPYFLIIAPQAIISDGTLNDFADYKRRLGFDVELHSLEDISANYSGLDLTDKIRNLEITRRTQFGSRFQYVMLVGPDGVIPYARMELGANDNPALRSDPQRKCRAALGGWTTDWYYADLVTNWDSNGNGCLGDGAFGDPSEQQKTNYIPDSNLKFQPTVSVGRIPLRNSNQIRNVLRQIMAFEQQTPSFKLKALEGMSMFSLRGDPSKGFCWFPPDNPNGQYYNAHTKIGNVDYYCDNINSNGEDGSYTGEKIRSQILAPAGFNAPDNFYENTSPIAGGSPYKSPQIVNQPLLVSKLNAIDYGLVVLEGHGNSTGVYRLNWIGDLNGDGAANNPTKPFGNPAKSAYEMGGGTVFSTSGLWQTFTQAGNGAIWLLISCSTGAWDNETNLGAELLSTNAGAAWIGGTGVLPTTTAAEVSTRIASSLFSSESRLGDAVWRGMGSFMQQAYNGSNRWLTGWWVFNLDLFGDPTLSYWGNPGGDATQSPWPMLRETAYGEGYSRLNGPSQPKQLWVYPSNSGQLDPLQPSPIVTRDNQVIVANAGFLDFVTNGQLDQRLVLNGVIFGTPALSADGTIYVANRGGLLYAIARNPVYHNYTIRWTVDLAGQPLTSPVIGADGFIAIAVEDGNNTDVVLVRPDSRLYNRSSNMQIAPLVFLPIPGHATPAMVVDANRFVYLATDSGHILRVKLVCNTFFSSGCFTIDPNTSAPYTTPPLLAYGSVYAGREDGSVVRKDMNTLAQQDTFQADDAITVGPITGPGSQVLVGTASGTLYSLTPALNLIWQAHIPGLRGEPAYTADSLLVVNGNFLDVRDPNNGQLKAFGNLGTASGGGSVAVGYGREAFVQTVAGPVVALGEGWQLPPGRPVAKAVIAVDIHGQQKGVMRINWSLSSTPGAPQASNPGAADSSILQPSATSALLLQRSLDGSEWQDLAVLPYGTQVYSDTAIQDGEWYNYRLQILDPAGADSDFSQSDVSVRSLPALPGAPTLNAVSVEGSDRLKINWTAASGSEQSSYRLERALTAAGPYESVAQIPGEASQYLDTGLTPDTVYFYRMTAINDSGESQPSNDVQGYTRRLGLAAPGSVSASLLPNGQIEVRWSGGLAGATAVVEGRAEGVEDYTNLGSSAATSRFDFWPEQVVRMSFRVKFVSGDEESPYSESVLEISLLPDTHLLFLPTLR